MSRKQWIAGATAALVLGVTAGTAVAGPTLDAIKQRGTLVCGVHTGLTEWIEARGYYLETYDYGTYFALPVNGSLFA